MNVNKIISKEENPEKRKLLYSVYLKNREYAVTKEQKDLLTRIIKAMIDVDRKYFLIDEDEAYIDAPMSIGYAQTISQPSTVARMLLLADLKKGQDVLEIGSGSGWSASLVGYLIHPGKLISVERIAPLSEYSRKNEKKLPKNVQSKIDMQFLFGNALNPKNVIWKNKYDRIVVAAGGSKDLVEELRKVSKLKNNGLLLFPTQKGDLELWKNKKGKLEVVHMEKGYSFVPLVGQR